MSKRDPYLSIVKKAIKVKLNDVFKGDKKDNFLELEGTSDLVYLKGVLEHSEHQRRDTRNYLALVKQGKYIGVVVPLCDNFPNRPYLQEEMERFGITTIHLSLEPGSIMVYVGKK